MNDIISKIKDRNFQDIKGSRINIRYPVTKKFIDNMMNVATKEIDEIQSTNSKFSYIERSIKDYGPIITVELNMKSKLPPFFIKTKSYKMIVEMKVNNYLGNKPSERLWDFSSDPWGSLSLLSITSIRSYDLGKMNTNLVAKKILSNINSNMPEPFYFWENSRTIGIKLRTLLRGAGYEFILNYIEDERVAVKYSVNTLFLDFSLAF